MITRVARFLAERLKEASSWGGVIISLVGLQADLGEPILQIAAGVGGLIVVLLPDRGTSEQERQ